MKDDLESILEQVEQIDLAGRRSKLSSLKLMTLLENKLNMEKKTSDRARPGMHIEGKADVRNPERVFGIVPLGGRCYFGHYVEK